MTKSNTGRFFEDYALGMVIDHAVPRTIRIRRARTLSRTLSSPQSALFIRRFCETLWTTPVTHRRSNRISCDLWQDSPRYIAQRCGEPRLCGRALVEVCLSGRHIAIPCSEVIGLKRIPTANLAISMFARQGLTNIVNRLWNMCAG